MSQRYSIECKSSTSSMTITIVDSLNPFPGSDTWSCIPSDALSENSGTIANWGTTSTFLHASGVGPVIELNNFNKKIHVGQSGSGNKLDPDGFFPSGSFSWQCISLG